MIFHSQTYLDQSSIPGVDVAHGYDNRLRTERLGFNPWSGQIFDPRICLKIII